MVAICVSAAGHREQEFQVHKNFICHHASYFDATFNGNFAEGADQKVNLEDVRPAGLRHMRDGDLEWVEHSKLIHLWLLADRLLVPSLQNQVMGILRTEDWGISTISGSDID